MEHLLCATYYVNDVKFNLHKKYEVESHTVIIIYEWKSGGMEKPNVNTQGGEGRDRFEHGQSDIRTCALNHYVRFLGKSAAQIITSVFILLWLHMFL